MSTADRRRLQRFARSAGTGPAPTPPAAPGKAAVRLGPGGRTEGLAALEQIARRGLAEARRLRKYAPMGGYTACEQAALTALAEVARQAAQLQGDRRPTQTSVLAPGYRPVYLRGEGRRGA